MIEAVRWAPFLRWFTRQATARLRSTFAAVHVRGLSTLQAEARGAPLLLIANHTAWWDPLVALWLSLRQLEGVASYGMMDAANLQRFRFFRWIGAFGVDRTSRRDGALASRYAIGLLQRRDTALWLFPQGAEQPPHVPLRFEPGAAGIARRAPAVRVIPVAFAYVFEGEERPQVYVSVGAALRAEDATDPRAQERAVEAERARIRRHLETRDEAFEPMLVHQPSTLGRLATQALDRLAGWLTPRQAKRRALPAAPGGSAGDGRGQPPAPVEP